MCKRLWVRSPVVDSKTPRYRHESQHHTPNFLSGEATHAAPFPTASSNIDETALMASSPAQQDSQPAKKGPSALRSIIAGSTAGAIEIGLFVLVFFE